MPAQRLAVVIPIPALNRPYPLCYRVLGLACIATYDVAQARAQHAAFLFSRGIGVTVARGAA